MNTSGICRALCITLTTTVVFSGSANLLTAIGNGIVSLCRPERCDGSPNTLEYAVSSQGYAGYLSLFVGLGIGLCFAALVAACEPAREAEREESLVADIENEQHERPAVSRPC